MRTGLVAGLLAGLAACSSSPKPAPPPTAPPPPAPTAQALAPAPAPPPVVAQTPIPPSPQLGSGPPPDECGAWQLQGLVGKPRTDIPVPADLSHRRVYCTACVVTQDYDPSRLNIVFDAQTGLVTQVRCG